MVEIIAGVYVFSFVVAGLLGLWNYVLLHRQQRSRSLAVLNENLKKIDLFWSTSEENFAPLTETSVSEDAHKSRRSGILIGLLALLGLPGLILMVIVLVSLKLVGPRRRTLRVFGSELTQSVNLSTESVRALHREIAEAE